MVANLTISHCQESMAWKSHHYQEYWGHQTKQLEALYEQEQLLDAPPEQEDWWRESFGLGNRQGSVQGKERKDLGSKPNSNPLSASQTALSFLRGDRKTAGVGLRRLIGGQAAYGEVSKKDYYVLSRAIWSTPTECSICSVSSSSCFRQRIGLGPELGNHKVNYHWTPIFFLCNQRLLFFKKWEKNYVNWQQNSLLERALWCKQMVFGASHNALEFVFYSMWDI